ncbi:hypothetical protein NP233_g9409 [Leucocoprinus birnbaumii]|uniref:Uncharacterized protein n=1 Tax=Leucocoprinus birnbaumii TaxID=56174 RepID=A0AAD5VL38_9AGAR|nr:hypothetical protein NP233_g9409 [Leucocoprinus birnbaumii]
MRFYFSPRNASHAAKLTRQSVPQGNTGSSELPSSEADSTPAGLMNMFRATDNGYLYTKPTPYEPEHTANCGQASIPLDGTLAARSKPDCLCLPTCARPSDAPHSTNPTFASVSTSIAQPTALLEEELALILVSELREMTASGLLTGERSGRAVSALQRHGLQLLRSLDAGMSAELLCLLGTASGDQDASEFHQYSRKWGQASGRYWKEVIAIAEAKKALGQVIGEREIYWITRAYLDEARATDSLEMRSLAKAYYQRLPTKSRFDHSVIIPYLNIFLFSPSSADFSDAFDFLCDALRQRNPHQCLVEILWRMILARKEDLSLKQKTLIIKLMRHRLSVPGTFNHRERRAPLFAIGDLVMALASSFFPCYREAGLSAGIFSWAQDCARSSVAEDIPIDECFSNLVLIANWSAPQDPFDVSTLPSTEWKIIIDLAFLDRSIRSRTVVNMEKNDVIDVVDVARSLWHSWKGVASSHIPQEVSRAVTTCFLQIATRLGDGVLLSSCLKYISKTRLSIASFMEAEAKDVEQLFGALSECVPVFKGQIWTQILTLLGNASHSPFHLSLYLQRIFRQLGAYDADLAYQFYRECLARRIPVSPIASIFIVQNLALDQSWDQVATFLQGVRFDDPSSELFLETVLSIFRSTRQEVTLPALAGVIGEALLLRFTTADVPLRLKYPIRFFLPIMISSGQPHEAIDVLEALLCKNQNLFSSRYFLRVIRTLLDHRQFKLGLKVFHLAAGAFESRPAIVIDLARKTRYTLARTGASKLASRLPIPHSSHQTVRDRLVRLSLRTPTYATGQSIFRLLPKLTATPISGPAVLIAVQVLLRNRRFALARRLVEQSFSHLKRQDLTAIGNSYLHGHLVHWNKRNGRLMRQILRSKDFFVQKYGFAPDRITVNIVIKAMLSWRNYVDSRNVMSLFDHLVRNGYPASKRWHIANNVPFGTLPGEMALDLSGIRQGLSFKRHVRPLYKMFIRELFLRGNPRAAHTIIGILKEEEALAAQSKEYRERVRRLGVARKLQRDSAHRKKVAGEAYRRDT